jgi:carbon storage regulator
MVAWPKNRAAIFIRKINRYRKYQMLSLTRKSGETITIGDEVYIQVVQIRKNKVVLGIVAPKGIRVDRLEVKIARAKEAKTCDPSQ